MPSQDKETQREESIHTLSAQPARLQKLLDQLMRPEILRRLRPSHFDPWYSLSEIFNLKKGRVPGKLSNHFNDDLLPYINIKAFERGEIEYYADKNDGVRLYNTDLIMVWDGARAGLAGCGQDGVLGSTLKKLTRKSKFNQVPLSYLYYHLQAQYYYLNTQARGSVIRHVDTDLFNHIKIPIPPPGSDQYDLMIKVLSSIELIERHELYQLKLIKDLKSDLLQTCCYPR